MTAFRTIDVGGVPPVVPAEQAVPSLDWVRIDHLVIDDRFQRPLGSANWAAIRRIAAGFSCSKFAPVLVAPVEGGRFSIIDGQHRTHAAAICGITSVPAMISHLTLAQQAAAFAGVNGAAIRIGPHQIYKAALAADEAWAVAARDAVAAGGCRLMTFNPTAKNRKPGEIYCVALIRKLMAQEGGPVAVTRGLAALRAADTVGRAAWFSDFVLLPYLWAVRDVPQISEARLTQVLGLRDPFKVIARADEGGVTSGAARRAAFVRLFAWVA